MKDELHIIKASGKTAVFSEEKLKNSLQRVGASPDQINSVINEIIPKLYDGITTKKIYRMAFSLLKESSRHIAAKYHLKQAIMELGPSGFPFEKYVGEILAAQKYSTEVGVMVQGKCVSHEIDVIARRDQLQLMIECKYHNLPGTYCDVKIPLYIHARFNDVTSVWLQSPTALQYRACVVTNTRFSSDAIQYGICSGLKLIGWDYPLQDNLKDQIDKLALYPITCLTSLTKTEKQALLERGIVLCRELYTNDQLLEQLQIKPSRMDVIRQEIHQLCKNLIIPEKVKPV